MADKKCRWTGRRSTITLLPVRSHSGINTFCLPWQWRARDQAPTMTSSKTLFLVNSAYTDNVLNARVHVETLVILRAKFHVVSSLLGLLKIAIARFTTVNLISASFFVIMNLHKGLTHMQSQIKPRLHFGESFTLMLSQTFLAQDHVYKTPVWVRWICVYHCFVAYFWKQRGSWGHKSPIRKWAGGGVQPSGSETEEETMISSC